MNKAEANNIIQVRNLKVFFPIRKGVLGKAVGQVRAVDDVSFEVKRGEVFALVGESGCGKTTTAHAILGLTPRTSGEISLSLSPWKGEAISWDKAGPSDQKLLRRHLQVVFRIHTVR